MTDCEQRRLRSRCGRGRDRGASRDLEKLGEVIQNGGAREPCCKCPLVLPSERGRGAPTDPADDVGIHFGGEDYDEPYVAICDDCPCRWEAYRWYER